MVTACIQDQFYLSAVVHSSMSVMCGCWSLPQACVHGCVVSFVCRVVLFPSVIYLNKSLLAFLLIGEEVNENRLRI